MRLRMAARRDAADESAPDPLAIRSAKRAEMLTAATGSGKSPRVALEQQVQSQAPPRAVRYRLVVGVEQKFQNVVIAPEDSAWNLMPFQAPDDLRLVSGHTYRIVWIDGDGNTVRPLEWAATPSLHFFLGAPDAEISAQQVEQRHQTQLVMQLRQQVDQLQRQLARAKRKQHSLREKMRAQKRSARDRIATLKFQLREDSFEAVVQKWVPVAALAAGIYWLGNSPGPAEACAAKSRDAQGEEAVAPSKAEREVLSATEEAPPPRDAATDGPGAASQTSEKVAPADLRSLVLLHGPQVLRRMLNDLLARRALVRELFAKNPRRADPQEESEGEDRADPTQSTTAQSRSDEHASSTQDAPMVGQQPPTESLPRAPGAGAYPPNPPGRTRTAAGQPQAETATHHDYPALLPDDLQRQLVTALSEDPSFQEMVASVLAADESAEARRRRGDPLYDVVASLDPTLRAELLDTVRATFRASQGEAELN